MGGHNVYMSDDMMTEQHSSHRLDLVRADSLLLRREG
jgi:hypothetical protein